jgi:RNase P subunit RPR2
MKTRETSKNFFEVVARGYVRKIRVGNKLVSQKLPDLKFRICKECGHWPHSGAGLFCRCPKNCHREPSGNGSVI